MIVTCEQCQARFKLDEQRIPAKGARVRCSRCKHAFHVAHPSASRDEALAEVVAEATGPGSGRVPGATADPFGPGDTDPGLSGSLSQIGEDEAGAGDGEEAWEFNEDPPVAPKPRRRARPAAAAGAPPAEARRPRPVSAPRGRPKRAPEPPGEELGSPEQWDLLGSARPARAPVGPAAASPPVADEEVALELATPRFAEKPPAPEPPPPPAAPRRKAAAPSRQVRAAPAAAAAAERREIPAPGPLGRVGGLAAATAGWIVALVLLVAGLVPALRAPPVAAPTPPAARSGEVFGLAAGDVRGAYVENSFAGPLYVVTGHLESAAAVAWGAHGALEVQIVGAAGAALPEARALAGPPLAEELVRELPPEQVRAELARQSAALLAPPWASGERRPFQAVFATLPEGAADLALVGVALPPPAPSEPAAGEEAGARASSPPSPRPSSG